MGKKDWWQRSLNSRLRSLEAKSSHSMKPRQKIEEMAKPTAIVCEAVTVIDLMERRRIAKELAWKSKWNTRKAKLGACSKKCR